MNKVVYLIIKKRKRNKQKAYSYFCSLLFTKSHLEEVVYGVEEALHTCKYMLALWKDVYEAALEK